MCILPVYWYEESRSTWGHAAWVKGGTAANNSTGPPDYDLTISGKISATFKGSLPARLVVATEYSLGLEVSIAHKLKVTVSPKKQKTLWGTVDGYTHYGKVNFDTLVCVAFFCDYRVGSVENVEFFIPSAPLFTVTETDAGKQPPTPNW